MFYDRATTANPRKTADGYLVADALVSRAGCYTYSGREVGRPELSTVTVYRPQDEVFSREAINSLTAIPLTLDHPSEPVNASNWKKYAIGEAGPDVVRDGEHVRLSLILKDAAAISALEAGKRELSLGYECQLDWGDGVAPDGTPYQATQRGLKMNHLAIVDAARAGSECRIGDSATVVNDGLRAAFDAANRGRIANGRPPLPESQFHREQARQRYVDGITGKTAPAATGSNDYARGLRDAARADYMRRLSNGGR